MRRNYERFVVKIRKRLFKKFCKILLVLFQRLIKICPKKVNKKSNFSFLGQDHMPRAS